MTIDFYYSPGSGPCRFVELTAKTLGLTLNHKLMDLMVKKDHLTPEFIKINPQHCIPTIVDNGFSVWESSVIATYLVQTYAKDDALYPKDPKKRSVVDQRLYFNLGVLGQRFADYYYPIMLSNATPDQEKCKKLQDGVEILNTFLEGKQYVAGDTLTVADLAISSTIATFDAVKFDRTSYKNVTKWYAKIQSTVPGFEEINGLEKLHAIFEAYRKSRQ
ncbi:hypothetical protein RI129_006451 [Pyrocoelia pectoralis]|uniref:Uncharacterized protein n=1 Tax=Pyrocoelia pectoralis TaxID=417401 RepID=A0AAN7VH85_9COLE